VVLASKDFVSPLDLIAVTTAFFDGEIFLDPASSSNANSVVQATRYFDWKNNGLLQSWKAKNVYLYPPRDIALKNEQPRSTRIFEEQKYFKKSNQRVWLELAYSKWLKKEFDEGIVFLTSTEVALLVTQKVGIDLPICILKEHPSLLNDDEELKPLKQSKVFGFVLYLPSINNYQQRIHDFRQQYSDLGRVYL
tara:strand:- start:7170 stop:7748 length:579 start_codon:yes stop_codon:yes gene_type:complete